MANTEQSKKQIRCLKSGRPEDAAETCSHQKSKGIDKKVKIDRLQQKNEEEKAR